MRSDLYVGERRYLSRHLETGHGVMTPGPVEVLGFNVRPRSPVKLVRVLSEQTGAVATVPAYRLAQASHRIDSRDRVSA